MNRDALIDVFEQVKDLVSLPGNDFSWSSWQDAPDALGEIDEVLDDLRSGRTPRPGQMAVLFAPTGPLQELSISTGWGDSFIELACQFDAALADGTVS